MRTTIYAFLALLFFVLAGCGQQPQRSDEPQKTVEVPKVDLHSAIVTGELEIVQQHIKAGSDLNVLEPSKASTPLLTAAALGNAKAAKLLIEAGADLNYKNAEGSNALHTAAAFGNTEVAKVLIDAGIDLNAKNNDGSTALITAAFLCRPEIVELLVENGADKTIKNKDGKTALEIMELPFEDIQVAYEFVGSALRPLGINLDYEYIKATRPQIAEMLR